jgi:hypothetical protein
MEVGVKLLQGVLADQFTRYPQMQMADLYKMLLQAALGNEHAIRNEQTSRDWLTRELAEMGTGPDDPFLDPISADGQIVRVHLRPYLQAGKDPEKLLRAFVLTANEWHGSLEKFKEYAATAAQMVHPGLSQFLPVEFKAFFAKMEAQDFPVMHHSDVYERLYHPAYRVVARQYLEEI